MLNEQNAVFGVSFPAERILQGGRFDIIPAHAGTPTRWTSYCNTLCDEGSSATLR
jgi:hypothetical protein